MLINLWHLDRYKHPTKVHFDCSVITMITHEVTLQLEVSLHLHYYLWATPNLTTDRCTRPEYIVGSGPYSLNSAND